jgi:hypothetical protein
MTNEEAVHRGLIVPGYRNQKSIRLLSGKADPRAVGVRAPLGSKFFQRDGSDFNKTGGGNFDWTPCCGPAAEESAAEESITWDRERINFVDDDPATTVVVADDATALATAVAAAVAGDIIEVQNFATVYDGFDFPAGVNLIVRAQSGSSFNIREKLADVYCVGLLDGSNGNTIARANFVPVANTSDGVSDETAAGPLAGVFVKSCVFTDCAVGVDIDANNGATGIIVEDCEFFDCDTPVHFVGVIGGVIRECFNQNSLIGYRVVSSVQIELVLTASVESTDVNEGDGFRFEQGSEASLYGCSSAFNIGAGFFFGRPNGGGIATGRASFQMINCVGHENGLSGVIADGGSYGRVTNSIFTDNGTEATAATDDGITAIGESMVNVRSCWFNTNVSTVGVTADATSFANDMAGNFGFLADNAGDPDYVDTAGFDFSVDGNSPVQGAGQNQADLGINPERHHRTLDDRGQQMLFSTGSSQDLAFFQPGAIADDQMIVGGDTAATADDGITIENPTIFRRAAVQFVTAATTGGADTVIEVYAMDSVGTVIMQRTLTISNDPGGGPLFQDIPSINTAPLGEAGIADGIMVGAGGKIAVQVITAGGTLPPEDINVFLGGDVPAL